MAKEFSRGIHGREGSAIDTTATGALRTDEYDRVHAFNWYADPNQGMGLQVSDEDIVELIVLRITDNGIIDFGHHNTGDTETGGARLQPQRPAVYDGLEQFEGAVFKTADSERAHINCITISEVVE